MGNRLYYIYMRYFFCLLLVLGLGTSSAHAATLYMDPNTANLNRGDAVKISVRLDTDEAAGECINALDAVISYSESIIPVDISVGKSILPIWVESPVINKENRTISFAGGIPNGYCGRVAGDPNLTNTLVEIFFRAPGLQIGGGEQRFSGSVQFTDATTAYLNDGLGTKANLRTIGATLALADNVGPEIIDPWSGDIQSDSIMPEEFSATVEQINKEWYVVFNTTDKQTGISHYEVIEESKRQANLFGFGAANAPWEETKSPHRLNDQKRTSVIRVKAIDKAGNEYVTTIPVDESQIVGRYSWLEIMLLIGVLMIVLITLVSIFYYRRTRSRAKLAVNTPAVTTDII